MPRKSASNATPLTDRRVQSLVRIAIPGDHLDGATSGLYLRVGRRSASWSLLYRVTGHGGESHAAHKLKGAMTRLHLGDYPAVNLSAARHKAVVALRQAGSGEDPRRPASSPNVASKKTLTWLVEEYLEKHANKTLANAKIGSYVLKRHWTLVFGKRAFSSLARSELNDRLREIAASPDHGPGAAMDARRWIMRVYGWAIRTEVASNNPAVNLIGKDELRQKPEDLRPGERVLTLEETRAVYGATFKMPSPWGELARILLLTLARLGEFSQCKREWFDRAGRNLDVPGMSHKNKQPKTVPLTDLAFAILDQRPKGEDGTYLFSTTKGEKAIYSFADNQADKLRALAAVELGRPLAHFTPHDFRRTGSTHLTGLGINEEVVEMLLGHKIKGVRGIYMKHKFLEERRNALRVWEAKIAAPTATQSVSETNVVNQAH
jgi:integrase